jgi:Tetracyclin repressor-like, C-terminal domain
MSARTTIDRTSETDRLEALALASCRRMNAMLERASRDWSSPIAALRHAIRAYSTYAGRFPARFRLILEEPDIARQNGESAMEMRRAFLTIARLVQAAQQAGDLMDGDPTEIAALIIGATHGQADLDFAGVSGGVGESMPLLLLDLLGREAEGADAHDADAMPSSTFSHY